MKSISYEASMLPNLISYSLSRFSFCHLLSFCSFHVRVTFPHSSAWYSLKRKGKRRQKITLLWVCPFPRLVSLPFLCITVFNNMKENVRKTNNFYIPLVNFHRFFPCSTSSVLQGMVPSSERRSGKIFMYGK